MTGSLASGRARLAVLGAGGLAAVAGGVITDGAGLGITLASAGGFALGVVAAFTAYRDRGVAADAELAAPADAPVVPAPSAAGATRTSEPAPPITQQAAVAAVAHDMSNPLACIRSNIEWLRDALENGRLRAPEEQAEAREVLRDAREAAERLRVDVGVLRQAGRDGAMPPPP